MRRIVSYLNRSSFRHVGFFLMLLLTATADPSAAGEPERRLRDKTPEQPWHIEADEISYDQKADLYLARGGVTISKEGKRLSADFVRFEHRKMLAYASGHVVLVSGGDVLTGDSMEVDLSTETGTVYSGTVFMKENHFYIRGDALRKIGENTYAAERASVSSCDGDRPAWKITGRNLKVTLEGYGFISHAAFWAGPIPILYSPFLVFPAKTERQSGLLLPMAGFSDRKGFEYIQPFYWAIGPSSDATFYTHYMADRGTRLGLEYRYDQSPFYKGTLMFDHLSDRKVEDGSPEGSEYGFEGDAATRPNPDRYWFRMKHNQNLPNGFFAMLDLDVVSDQDYLREFREGITGFDDSKAYFLGLFGRELDDYTDPVRLNRLNISRIWSTYSFNAEARWYDDVIARRQGTPPGTDSVLQRLPFVEFTALRQPLLSRFLYYDLSTEYNHFFRESGSRGHRADLYPRVYMPLRFRPYLSLEPSAGYRQTVWHIDTFENATVERERTEHREIFDFRLDLFSELSRIYSSPFAGIDRIRHSVRPRFIYDYIPEQDQTRFPQFDPLDRIERENVLTYSLTNTWTARMKQIPGRTAGHSYLTFLRLYLEQRYDFNAAREEDPKPLSPILAEVILSPASFLSLQADAEWSVYEDRFISRNVAATFWNSRRDRLMVEHRYAADVSESLYADLLVHLTDGLAGYVEYEENLLTRTRLRQGIGFMYTRQCWSVDVGYAEEEEDRRYTLMVNLFGIGGIGTKFVGRVSPTPFERFQNRAAP